MFPPKSLRWCPVCEADRVFDYNPRLTHSECVDCGGHVGAKFIRYLDLVEARKLLRNR